MSTSTTYELTNDERALLQELTALQGEMSDRDFSARYLSYSGSAWNRMKSALKPDSAGGYFAMVGDARKVFVNLQSSLMLLKRGEAMRRKAETGTYHELPPFAAVFKAIDECREKKGDPNRLIVFLAETGGGKSKLGERITVSRKFVGIVVEARQSWKKSEWNALTQIAEAAGLNTRTLYSKKMLEDGVVDFFNKHDAVLFIDEAEYFGPDVINLIKFLLNESSVTIVVAALPEAYARWNDPAKRSWHEAKQLKRRTHAIVRGPGGDGKAGKSAIRITPEQAQKFLEGCNLNGSMNQARAMAAKAANEFGAYDFLTRLATELRNDTKPDLDDVENAITRVKAFIGVE
jgi:hypothetical protein